MVKLLQQQQQQQHTLAPCSMGVSPSLSETRQALTSNAGMHCYLHTATVPPFCDYLWTSFQLACTCCFKMLSRLRQDDAAAAAGRPQESEAASGVLAN
jgi:hypothetical protein